MKSNPARKRQLLLKNLKISAKAKVLIIAKTLAHINKSNNILNATNALWSPFIDFATTIIATMLKIIIMYFIFYAL